MFNPYEIKFNDGEHDFSIEQTHGGIYQGEVFCKTNKMKHNMILSYIFRPERVFQSPMFFNTFRP